MICRRYETVIVPFPFTDRSTTKRRPALALSDQLFAQESGHTLLAMITSAKNSLWSSDVSINFLAAGLRAPSKVRLKLFTLDNRLIAGRIGTLDQKDRQSVDDALRSLLGLF